MTENNLPSGAEGGVSRPLLEVDALTRKFHRDSYAVDGVSFTVNRGELISLLGPSGCGKTTTLRMIAGFERPDGGDIRVNGVSITDVRPQKRPVGFVFQQYSLFPHMSVAENIAFGLKARGADREMVKEKLAEALRVVRLQGYENRVPTQLSGGEQQRVALARVIVTEPDLVLLDEPFGALDRKLRDDLQVELKDLLTRLSLTAIFVTHDQDEALLMSDRIAVMNGGRIEQMASPSEVYERPSSMFVASFVGVSNTFVGTTASSAHGFAVRSDAGMVHCAGSPVGSGEATLVIRPEKVAVAVEQGPGENWFRGTVGAFKYTGDQSDLQVALDSGRTVVARLLNAGAPDRVGSGDRVWVQFPPEHVVPVKAPK